jgi:hypothetical protein
MNEEDNLKGRDFQLLAFLEMSFPRTSFLQQDQLWISFDGKATVTCMLEDVETIKNLVRKGKVTHLGLLNNKPHYVIKKEK